MLATTLPKHLMVSCTNVGVSCLVPLLWVLGHLPSDFKAGVIVTRIVVLVMTIAKRKVSFGQSPVASLPLRYGACSFVFVRQHASSSLLYTRSSDVRRNKVYSLTVHTTLSPRVLPLCACFMVLCRVNKAVDLFPACRLIQSTQQLALAADPNAVAW
ncbi:hypothetical protein B0H34DRAFT_522942 [Crassisporium funariophilum]|nr:hypothetical protein B0H34DRAFT_522942 [Crassisporium funariophilum]